MNQKVGIGIQDFAKLRENNMFYIDKTSFIKEWWETGDDVTLITRPRRFGKTLTLSMTEYFFTADQSDTAKLFHGLDIWKDKKYQQLQGTYPVIFLSFADIKGNTFEKTRMGIIHKLVKLYSDHDFLKKQNILNEKDLEYFDSVRSGMEDDVAVIAVKYLADYLSRYYGKKVIILLDEYDTPLQEAYVYGYWNELTEFIRSLFNSTFKTNPYLERGLLTGITRVSKESVFSDLNNLEVVTTTTEKYEDSFGFTEEEVFAALDQREMSDRQEMVKKWYDGFSFGSKTDIYNPWSITKFLDTGEFRTYWADTSENSLVSKLLREGSAELKTSFEDILRGEELLVQLDEQIVFEQLQKKKGAIWSLLLASGYLKVTRVEQNLENGRYYYHLKLTNYEVRLMFEDMIEGWFPKESTSYGKFVQALLMNDLDYMNEYMNQVALQTFSTFDTGTQPSEYAEPERFYHGFVLGLIVELADIYRITSNRESGLGRYDVIMEPLQRSRKAVVMEFKVHNPVREKSLEDTVENALQQIEDKKYDTDLIARGIKPEQICHYGFAFEGKTVLIGSR